MGNNNKNGVYTSITVCRICSNLENIYYASVT